MLTVEHDDAVRPLDAETDLFPLIDWSRADLAGLAVRLPKDARAADTQTIRLQPGKARGQPPEQGIIPAQGAELGQQVSDQRPCGKAVRHNVADHADGIGGIERG